MLYIYINNSWIDGIQANEKFSLENTEIAFNVVLETKLFYTKFKASAFRNSIMFLQALKLSGCNEFQIFLLLTD